MIGPVGPELSTTLGCLVATRQADPFLESTPHVVATHRHERAICPDTQTATFLPSQNGLRTSRRRILPNDDVGS